LIARRNALPRIPPIPSSRARARSQAIARRAACLTAGLALAAGVAGCNKTVTGPPPHVYPVAFASQETTSVGSNIVADFRVNRTGYDTGDTIRLALTLHNINGQGIPLSCRYTTNQRYDYIVRDSTLHVQVWRWSDTQQFGEEFNDPDIIADGDSMVYETDWNMRDSTGMALDMGHLFTVTAYPLCVLSRITWPALTFTTRAAAQ